MLNESRVAVLIVNWNNFPDTSKCLVSLEKLIHENYQVIVVDNGSKDGSNIQIKEKFPDIILLESGENLGFAGGNNIGIDFALSNDFEFILLLNNDTEVIQGDFLGDLLDQISRDALFAAIGPKVLKPDGDPQNTILPYPTMVHTIRNTLGLYHPDLDIGQRVDSITGCCVLIRSAAIKTTGMLDENFFIYGEETEWFFRMRKKGWKILYHPVKSIIHKGASSSKKIDNQKIYIERRANVIYTLVKANQKLEAFLTALLMILLLGIRIIGSALFYRKKPGYPISIIYDLIKAFRQKWNLAQDLTEKRNLG